MPKRKTPAEKPEKQFERFIEAARTAGVDEEGKKAEEAFKALSKGAPQSPKKN